MLGLNLAKTSEIHLYRAVFFQIKCYFLAKTQHFWARLKSKAKLAKILKSRQKGGRLQDLRLPKNSLFQEKSRKNYPIKEARKENSQRVLISVIWFDKQLRETKKNQVNLLRKKAFKNEFLHFFLLTKLEMNQLCP